MLTRTAALMSLSFWELTQVLRVSVSAVLVSRLEELADTSMLAACRALSYICSKSIDCISSPESECWSS